MTAREAALADALRDRAQAAHMWSSGRRDRDELEACRDPGCVAAVRLLAEPDGAKPTDLASLRLEGVTDAEWDAFDAVISPPTVADAVAVLAEADRLDGAALRKLVAALPDGAFVNVLSPYAGVGDPWNVAVVPKVSGTPAPSEHAASIREAADAVRSALGKVEA